MTPQSKEDPRSDPLLRDVPEVEGYKVLDRRYVLFETLGQGGMGVVYRGKHTALDIDVAIKCLDPSLVRRNDEFVMRFEKEARAAARIQHENVVRVFDVADSGGLHYLVMEFVEGEDARRRVSRKGALSPDESARIILGAARGLTAAHAIGLVHRDIKPDNIMIGSNGRVKVADLGLAKQVDGDSGLTYSGATLGTPRYMPPEQFGGAKGVGPAADVYALGATLYFLLTGKDGIPGGSLMEVVEFVRTQAFPDPRAIKPDLPASLAELVANFTQKDPALRPPDAAAVVAAFEKSGLGHDIDLSDPEAGSKLTDSMVSPPPAETIVRIRRTVTDSGVQAAGVPSPESKPDSASPPNSSQPANEQPTGKRLLVVLGVLGTVALVVWLASVSGILGPKSDPDPGPVNGPGPTPSPVDPNPVDPTPDQLSWAQVLEQVPDPQVVTDADGRQRMLATGLPWRVRDKATGIEFLLVPPGEDLIGASGDDQEAYTEEMPAHTVKFSEPFYLGRSEVTRGQWNRVMGLSSNASPSELSRPIASVSWDQLTQSDDGFLAKTGMRLPRECEWEYASRAGTDAPLYGDLDEIAWYGDNSGDERQRAVGTRVANPWGFVDQFGNVSEWCSTAFDQDLYEHAQAQEPVEASFCDEATGKFRVLRGGSWKNTMAGLRASCRAFSNPSTGTSDIGFRVARNP